MIGIVTVHDDLHALAILREFTRRRYDECHVVEIDNISLAHGVSLRLGRDNVTATVTTRTGAEIRLADLGVLWLRRPFADQLRCSPDTPTNTRELINSECRCALSGLLSTGFHGRWISTPEATLRASDKLAQLAVARGCGFRTPDTLVSQSREDVAQFFRGHNRRIIVKAISGTNGPILLTQFMQDPHNLEDASFKACPGLYQEYIPGTRHIRLNCFGARSFAASIDTEALDWRPDLTVPILAWPVPDEVHRRVRRVLDHIGLDMGIVDLKETPDGELVWLEVNPQGQFLFLESLTGQPLASYFADYLLSSIP
jgi:hypothetical protein